MPSGPMIRAFISTLFISFSSAQLFGLGSTIACPTITVTATNTDNTDLAGDLLLVLHDARYELIPLGIQDTAGKTILNRVAEAGISASQVDENWNGASASPYVCGTTLGEGIEVIEADTLIGSENGVMGYETVTMSPVNSEECSCSDMVFSALANYDNTWGSLVDLFPIDFEGTAFVQGYGTWYTASPADIPVKNNYPEMCVKLVYTPGSSSSSTSLLTLWALLMNGWY